MLFVKDAASEFNDFTKPSAASDEALLRLCDECFDRYYTASVEHRERFRTNDLFYQDMQWELVKNDDRPYKPHTPALWATCDNIRADIVEGYPRLALQAQSDQYADKSENIAHLLNSLLKRRGFHKTWDMTAGALTQQGNDVWEIFWDQSLYNGKGDANLQRWSIKTFLFDPQVGDIQDSPCVIKYKFIDHDVAMAMWPKMATEIARSTRLVQPYDLTGSPEKAYNTERLTVQYEMWWKEIDHTPVLDDNGVETGTTASISVHYAMVVGGALVDRQAGPGETVYQHRKYPFVVLGCDPIEGSIYSFGFIDRFRQDQMYIDFMNAAILENAQMSAKNRLLVNNSANLDMDALKDWKKDLIKGDAITDQSVRWFSPIPFPNAQMQFANDRKAAMKDDSGQNDFNRGEGGKGVTAASAIMTLQEAGNKRSRMMIRRQYDGFEEAGQLLIQVMAQFYTEDRIFTLVDGGDVKTKTVSPGDFWGDDEQMLDFQVAVHAEKNPGYATAYNNAMVQQLMQSQALPPQVGLEMLDFDRKQEIMKKLNAWEGDQIKQRDEAIAQLQQQIVQLQKNQAYVPPPAQEAPPQQDQPAAPPQVA